MNYITDTKPEKDWPEDFNHENGMYYCRCVHCKERFIGYKRRVVCRECDTTMKPTNTTAPVEESYDVVIDTLQKHHDKLWDMTKNNDQWGIMDHIRLEQMQQLKDAMKLWKNRNTSEQTLYVSGVEDCGCPQYQVCNNVACPRALKVTC